MTKSNPEVKCYDCGMIAPLSHFINHKCKKIKISEREELIKKIENNDPIILGELADLILAQRGAPKLDEVKFTTKELNKKIREKVKR